MSADVEEKWYGWFKTVSSKKKQQNGIFRSEVIMWKETRNSTNCILGVRIICLEELLSVVAVTE